MFSGGVSSMSVKKTNASPREDKILPRTCISLFHTQGTSIDDTPPLIIRNHPPYHLHVTLVALLNTCTQVCIIPRRYPTAKHQKSASFSLAAALVVLLNTCTWIYIIPRLYPTLYLAYGKQGAALQQWYACSNFSLQCHQMGPKVTLNVEQELLKFTEGCSVLTSLNERGNEQ